MLAPRTGTYYTRVGATNNVFGYGIGHVILGIIAIILSQVRPQDCDIMDSGLQLHAADYLLGVGIVYLIFGTVFFLRLYYSRWHETGLRYLLLLALVLFSIIWCIIGGIVLFRSNIECIHGGHSVPVISALVYWCLTIFNLLFLGSII